MRSGCTGTWVVDIGVDVFPLEHVRDRSGEYGHVEPEGLAVDVFHVQRLAAFPGDVVASVDLCESGDTGLNAQLPLFRFCVEAELVHLVGPWTDEAHVAAKNVEALRKFVQAGSSEEAPHSRNSGVFFAGVCRTVCVSEVRSVVNHATKFQELERAPVLP